MIPRLENERITQERLSPARISDEPGEEEEPCLLLYELGKAIIDTGCGRCAVGVVTLEAHQSVI